MLELARLAAASEDAEAAAAGPRRRAAVRVERRAGRCRGDPRRAARRPGVPRPPRGTRRPTGGDARLLRFEQGIGLPRGSLDAPPGPGDAGRDSPGARRRADALPRSGRGHRARWRADQPGDPRPGAGLGRRAAQADRAGRGHRRQLREPDDRPTTPRADDRGGPDRPRPRSTTRDSNGRSPIGGPDPRRAQRRRRAPRTGRSSTTTRASRRSSATSRRSASCPTCGSGRDRRPAVGVTRPRSIDSLRAIPWTFAWSQSRINLPGWYGLGLAAGGVSGRARRGRAGRRSRDSAANGRSCRACSTTPR